MRAAVVIAAKDLRQRLRDRSAIILAFVAPVVMASIVSGAFGSGFGADSFDTSFAVLDLDRSELSRTFVDDVLLSDAIARFADVEELCAGAASGCDASTVRSAVDDEDAFAGFVIPENFGARATAGSATAITVIGRGDAPISAEVARSIATAFTDQVMATRLAVLTAVRTGAGDLSDAPQLAAAAARDRIPILLEQRDPGSRDVSGANYFGPSMAIFFIFFTVSIGAQGLLAERADGTLARLLAAPISRATVVGGKALAVFVLGLSSMVVMYLVMGVLFGASWGDPLAVGALTVLIVAAAMAVSAVVQTFAKTQEQASNYGTAVGMTFALLGGNFFPLFQLPELLQKIALVTPNGWALRGFTDIAYDGATFADLLPNIGALLGFAAVAAAIAAARARKVVLA